MSASTKRPLKTARPIVLMMIGLALPADAMSISEPGVSNETPVEVEPGVYELQVDLPPEVSGPALGMQSGYDTDHWWLIMTWTEIATGAAAPACHGLISATPLSLARGPICTAVATLAGYLVSQAAPSGGVWIAIYNNGGIQGGAW